MKVEKPPQEIPKVGALPFEHAETNKRIARYFKLPKLVAKKRYVLKSKTGNVFVRRATPLRETTEPEEVRTFAGAYLNVCAWSWHERYKAVPEGEWRAAQKKTRKE